MDVPLSALKGHLGHGDTLGACEVNIDAEPEVVPESVEPVSETPEPEPVIEPEPEPEV